jgi:hypothetical protein
MNTEKKTTKQTSHYVQRERGTMFVCVSLANSVNTKHTATSCEYFLSVHARRNSDVRIQNIRYVS